MVITTLLAYLVARAIVGCEPRWWPARWPSFFLVIDLAFFGANLVKIPHGGWFPLVVGAIDLPADLDLEEGARAARRRVSRERLYPFDRFLQDIAERPAAPRARAPRCS